MTVDDATWERIRKAITAAVDDAVENEIDPDDVADAIAQAYEDGGLPGTIVEITL